MKFRLLNFLHRGRLKLIRKQNEELEKQIFLQKNLNELLKEENEIQSQSS